MAVVPEQIGKYKIESLVAQGGMGSVYRAVHPSLKRQVIIKKLSIRGNTAIRERFKREAQILLDLSSPYIVRMFDYFSEGKNDYIVLELVDGMSLDKLIEKEVSLPPQLALLIFLDACYGLKNAHVKNIVHRDIKPGNILISKKAEVKLADFGIASSEKEDVIESVKRNALAVRSGKEGLTQAGTTLGTPAYMPPEQFDDSSSVDQRADIYSMGVMLYEMVTGSKPYSGDMAPSTIEKIKKGDYIAPGKLDKTLPWIVRSLIRKMMKPNPNKRYQSIDPVIVKIRKYLKNYDTHAIRIDLARAILTKSTYPLPKYETKNKKVKKISAIAAGIVLFIGLIGFAWTKGFFHYTILRPWYTPVTLSLKMPATASADADLPARAFFFENDNKDIPEVAGSRRVFTHNKKSGESGKNITYRTKVVFLKSGNYRIKIAEGPYIWWKSFTVNKDQFKAYKKKLKETNFFTPYNLDLNFLKNAKRNLTIHCNAEDYYTGEDITSKANFKIYYNKKYVDIHSVKPENLTTGTVWRFKINAEGYEEEYFSLLIDWYQDELFINSLLKQNGKK